MTNRLAKVLAFTAVAVAFMLCAAGVTAAPVLSDTIWSSRLAVKDGVSDFDNKTFADLFRDAKFQEVDLPSGQKVTFELDPKSVNGSDAVIDFVMKRDGRESERFSFYFRYKGLYTILYKLTSDRGTVEGPDELLKAMRVFYMPCLLQ